MASAPMVASTSAASASSGSDDSPTPPAELAGASEQERVSYYMLALDELVSLKETEGHLLNAYETAALHRFSCLPYESRYLFIRLFLRKQGWTRLRKIKYHEIGDVKTAADQLCVRLDLPPAPSPAAPPKRRQSVTTAKGVEVLDLTLDSEDEEDIKIDQHAENEGLLGDLSRIAYSTTSLARASPEQVLGLLSVDELQDLGKKLGVKPKLGTRAEWTAALLRTSKQATLNFAGTSFGMSYDAKGNKTHQMSRVLSESLELIGDSIRLAPPFYDLFCRLALILHRTAYLSATATKGKGKASNLTASLLARFGKRTYPEYKFQRTTVFPSRLTLVRFESALALESKMVDLIESPGSKEERRKRWIEGVNIAREIYPRWRDAVRECKERDKDFEYYKLRFHPGWAWTRVLHKAVRMHASLGNRAAEVEILTDLLAPDQPFRKGKRGAWADRLALVIMNYPSAQEEKCEDEKAKAKMKRRRLKRAKAIVDQALGDHRTHIIYVPQLSRRLARLHRMLDLDPPPTLSVQRTASNRTMEGTRLDDGEVGRHSLWRANDGDEVSVEELALEGYRRQGWSGRHAETGVLSMLFVLLFWDVIFDDSTDGVFETPWQSEPLDLRTDAFAVTRRDKIDRRLEQIAKGEAARLVGETDEREREKATFAVGVSWAGFTREEMQDIAECFEPQGLATIMKAFAEEYGHRTGGVPDLCLWNKSTKRVMFAEVKGPGDTLSETQKVWIDVLLNAGVETELCKVITTEEAMELEKNGGKKRGRKRSRASLSDDEDDE